jgi:hypothetical protein
MLNIDLDVTKIDKVCDYIRKQEVPDDETVHVHRSGVPCFVDAPAKVWKGISIQESAKSGPRFVKYVPMPMFWKG